MLARTMSLWKEAAFPFACIKPRRSRVSRRRFTIHCVYTDVEPAYRLREVVTGDLCGVLETLFRETPDGGGTRVTFNWYVRIANPALNLLGYVAEGIYRSSHDGVMAEGEEGLRRYCGARYPSVTRETV